MKKFTFAVLILSAMLVNIAIANKCPPPQDLIDRLEEYQSKAANDEEWNEIDGYINYIYEIWNDEKDWCSSLSRAYQEIIKEEGIPTNFSEELDLNNKIVARQHRLFIEDFNKKYSYGKANKCPPPQDLIDRLEGYQSKAANDEEWNDIYEHIKLYYEIWNDGYSEGCSDFLSRAYQEIIKEEGIPTNFSEELDLNRKIRARGDRLFIEDYNKKYGYGYGSWNGPWDECPPPQDLIDRLEGYKSKASNDYEWLEINEHINEVYKEWDGRKWDGRDWNFKCLDFYPRAYQEIIKEESIPTNYSEERKLNLKVYYRAMRLSIEDFNKKYGYGKANKCPPQDLIDRLEGYRSKASNDYEWNYIDGYIKYIYEKWNDDETLPAPEEFNWDFDIAYDPTPTSSNTTSLDTTSQAPIDTAPQQDFNYGDETLPIEDWNNKCRDFLSRAYQEIIKEEGIPTNFSEELDLGNKIRAREHMLSSEDYNKKYGYGYNYSFGKANKCSPPQDLIDRLEWYQSKAANYKEWNEIYRYIDNKYKEWNKKDSEDCSFTSRAYQEIIKEEGVPTNYSEERKSSLKVYYRAMRLSIENSNKKYSFGKANKCPPPQDLIDRLEGYRNKASNDYEWNDIDGYINEVYDEWNKKDSEDCSFTLRAYQEIIKEEGVPTNYIEELKLRLKVSHRVRKLEGKLHKIYLYY